MRKIAIQCLMTEEEALLVKTEALRRSTPEKRVSVGELVREIVLAHIEPPGRKTRAGKP